MDSLSYTLSQSFDFSASATILDVGCGPGEQLAEAPGRLKVGVEPDPLTASKGRENGFSIIRAKAEHLPFADNSFDGVICKAVLSYTLEDQAIREISRVLKPDRKFYLASIGSGYYLRYLLLGTWKDRLYGLRALVNTWWWALTGHRLPGFVGDTIYQSSSRLHRHFTANGLRVTSEQQRCFLGFPVFIYTELLS